MIEAVLLLSGQTAFVTAVWPDCICYCCLARLHLLVLSGQTAFVTAVWPDCICYCCLARLHLLLLSGQTAFAHCIPFFLQRLWPVCTVYLSKSDTVCTWGSTQGTYPICGSCLYSEQAFSSFPEHSIFYKSSLSISLVSIHVENTSVCHTVLERKQSVVCNG